MIRKTIALTIGAMLFAGVISTAHAAGNNPLHPSYFVAKAKIVKVISATQPAYIDARNPLHPMFGKSADWLMAGHGNVVHYVDNRNPLHPSFRWY